MGAQWLLVSFPFCVVAVIVGWLMVIIFHHFDASEEEEELSRQAKGKTIVIPAVIFESEDLTFTKALWLLSAFATLTIFACQPLADFFGGTTAVSMLFISLALGTGMISRQTFNSYSWHLLFLIGGGGALG